MQQRRFLISERQSVTFLVAVLALVMLFAPLARAEFNLGLAANYAVLYEGGGGQTLSYNSSCVVGDVGIGLTGRFDGAGAQACASPGGIDLYGALDLYAANTGQVNLNPNFIIQDGVNYGVANVNTALTTVNTLSHDLGLETGTALTINGSGSVNVTSGTQDANGNYVFTTTVTGFNAGDTFTITGGADDYVVFNIAGAPSGDVGFAGSILLSGGITPDHVLFNITPQTGAGYDDAYANLTGGPKLTLNNNSDTPIYGTFLNPTGSFDLNAYLVGHLFGGDSKNSSILSFSYVGEPAAVPEPASVLLLGVVILGVARVIRLRRA